MTTDHLNGGEAALLDAILGRLTMSGVTARAAIAETWGAAHALGRFEAKPALVAPAGHGSAVLLSLPLEALRPPATVAIGCEASAS
ncbi:hypothetical protein P7D22_09155 [Lichenihabitans sp. Uapishka_5]|uniref:hypothetical protein n=1 Tax=Lichenihabitans sp. Uapishka_5 TaxID=3037302 RepID=UPI0029E80AC7|nr:hypothetical protein [Lichenihabitans sp. Uapishka_5]MDX7951340.1 hypothetical protein [Lichenihabitans sp. Uapishka_5]